MKRYEELSIDLGTLRRNSCGFPFYSRVPNANEREMNMDPKLLRTVRITDL